MGRLKHALWAVPLACVAACLAVAIVTSAVDRAHPDVVPTSITGTATGAQTVLTTIASSMITLITLVLTVVTVAIQLAMAQFSPRIVQALLQDRANQLSFGLFGGTAVFTTVAAIQVDDQRSFVPGITVLLAYALTLASLVALVLYVDRAGQSLRVAGLIDLVGDNLHDQLADRYRSHLAGPGPADPSIVEAAEAGEVVAVDHAGLVDAARRAGCVLHLVPAMGDFVPSGGPLLRIDGDTARLDRQQVRGHVVLADERTHETDPTYGFRKLVDIATRDIGRDPTTAVQAIHRLHDALRQLVTAELPDGRHRDGAGEVRLVTREMTWEGFVHLAFDEIRLAGAGKSQVARRLRAALVDLGTVAPPSRCDVLERELELLDAAVRRSYETEEDIAFAMVPDEQSIGSGESMTC